MLKEKEAANSSKADKAHKVADDARSDAYRIVDGIHENGSAVIDEVQTFARQTGKKFRQFADQAEDATDTVKTKIRDYPIGSAAIAVGVGFLLGTIFRRS